MPIAALRQVERKPFFVHRVPWPRPCAGVLSLFHGPRFLRSLEIFDCDSEDTLLRDIRVNGMTLGICGHSMICFLLGPLLGIDQPTAAMMGVMEGLVEGVAVAMLHERYR